MRGSPAAGLAPAVKLVYLILLANALAAFVALLLAPGSEDWFAWTIAPKASARMLAAMYLSAILLVLLAIRATDWGRTRLVFWVLTCFSVVATIVTLTHLEPFTEHPWFHLAYWLGTYSVLVVVAPLLLVREERRAGGRLPLSRPLGPLARTIGAISGLALGATGAAIMISPATVSDLWPWELAPLAGRLFAVLLLTLASAYLLALLDPDWERVRPIFLQAPVVGVALGAVPLIHDGDVDRSLALYLAISAVLVANSAAILEQRLGRR